MNRYVNEFWSTTIEKSRCIGIEKNHIDERELLKDFLPSLIIDHIRSLYYCYLEKDSAIDLLTNGLSVGAENGDNCKITYQIGLIYFKISIFGNIKPKYENIPFDKSLYKKFFPNIKKYKFICIQRFGQHKNVYRDGIFWNRIFHDLLIIKIDDGIKEFLACKSKMISDFIDEEKKQILNFLEINV